MIVGCAKELEKYKNQIPASAYKVLEMMAAYDYSAVGEGKFPLGEYTVSVETPLTEPKGDRKAEAHRKFVDLVYEVDVEEEIIGCRPFSEAGELLEEYPDRDLYFYNTEGPESENYVKTGDFLIFTPADLHRPLCQGPKGALRVKKAVVKFPVERL